jgi:hypothetical protein
MKKLAISLDTRNRDLEIYENSTYVNYYQAPSGSDEAIEMPKYAGYVQVVSTEDDVWFKLGNETISASEPSEDIENGLSPSFIPAKGRVIHRIVEETHVSLESSGGVVLSYWRQ